MPNAPEKSLPTGPYRVARDPVELAGFLGYADKGSAAIEVHRDHSSAQVAHYSKLAADFDLTITGRSAFLGKTKPGIELGTARMQP